MNGIICQGKNHVGREKAHQGGRTGTSKGTDERTNERAVGRKTAFEDVV